MDNFGLNTIASQAIYKELNAGKIINANEYKHGELIPSVMFQALTNDIDKYRQLYNLLGFTLKDINGRAYFISREDRDEDLNETGANIHVILTVLSMGLFQRGTSPNIMLDPKAGISAKEVDAIGEGEQAVRILSSCSIQRPLTKSVNGTLVERGIFHRKSDDRYFLTDAGKHFFETLVDLYQNSGNENRAKKTLEDEYPRACSH